MRTRKRLLWLASLLLVAGLAATVWTTFRLPLASLKAGPDGGDRPSAAGSAAIAARPPLAHFAIIYERSLRKPLFDAPPPTPLAAPPPPAPKLTVTLTGTVIEPGNTYALFKDQGESVKLVGVGETIAGAEVLQITEGSATVRFNGQEMTLTVAKPKER